MAKSARGFTLIELLVAIVISMVLFSGGLAAYRGVGERQSVKQAGNKLQANLRLLQQKASSGEKPSDCGVADEFQGYKMNYNDSGSYLAQAVCQVAVPAADTINLPSGVTFVASFTEIFFPVLSSQVTGAQTITLTTGSYSYEVVIEAAGVVTGRML